MESRPSLEASTPEEALTLARAHHGPDVALDVQETRSGGVMGFFATQRFVAVPVDEPAASDSAHTSPGASHDASPLDGSVVTDVSAHADTVQREHATDLDAAIADASQTLGLPMSGPTRPIASVSAGLLHDTHPDLNRQHAPTGDADDEQAPAPSVPASPFAAALSRVTAEPVVTEAVMNVLDSHDQPTSVAAAQSVTPTAVDLTAVALYSVPMAAPTPALIDAAPAEPATPPAAVPMAAPVEPQAAPEASHINYAAALVAARSRNPLFPQAPAPVTAAPATVAPQAAHAPVPDTVPTQAPAAVAEAIPAVPAPAPAPLPATAAVAVPVAEPALAPDPTVEAALAQTAAMAAVVPHTSDPTNLLPRLDAAGFPVNRIPDLFLHEVGEKGIHTALTRLIKMRTTPAPALPVAPCTVVLVGPETEALTAAMGACSALRADASQVAWVGPAHLSGLVPATRRISTPENATAWLSAPKRATVVNVVAISTPISENIDPHTRAVIAALNPDMVLAVVEATRKSESITRWIEALDCVDAVALENASNTHDPATWLTLPAAPVALVEGRKATAARWASLLCERLTDLADVED